MEDKRLEGIVEKLKARYGENLAAIVIFGSYVLGLYKEGKSDIDSIILIKERAGIEDLAAEGTRLFQEMTEERLSVQEFNVLFEYEADLYERGRFTSWATMQKQKGCEVAYKTREFEEFLERLKRKPLEKGKVLKTVREKDDFDLKVYLGEAEGFRKTVCLFGHLRRKLQILNYYTDNQLEFDYDDCLRSVFNLLDREDVKKLENLNGKYKSRQILDKDGVEEYVALSKRMTPIVERVLKE